MEIKATEKPAAKNCLNPGCTSNKTIEGRPEKLFCSNECRFAYHNILKTEETRITGHITNILKKNRRILAKLLKEKQATSVSERVLLDKGFSFLYHTHNHVSKKNENEYIFCFDLGYRKLEDGWIQIVRSY